MTNRDERGHIQIQKGYQPNADLKELGYQPQAAQPVNPADLKPPRGDTAIELPKKPVPEQ